MKLITVLLVVAIFSSYVVDTTSAQLHQIRKKRFFSIFRNIWGLGGDSSSTEEETAEPSAAAISGPLSSDFSQWLRTHQSYLNWRATFERNDLGKFGSYGGKTNSSQQIKRNPIIFIHGNSDQALNAGRGPILTGWTQSIDYFLSQGYTSAELYATTWGPANLRQAKSQTHSCAYLTTLRKFTEAVIAYTGASKINIIGHSMGVTMARKVVRGGTHKDSSYVRCDLGNPLTNTVDTFIGIAGGNKGLSSCKMNDVIKLHPFASFFGMDYPSCNRIDGFHPSSKFLNELNSEPHRMEGENIFTIWSHSDIALNTGDALSSGNTEPIVGQDGEKVYQDVGHIECKDKTGAVQYAMVTNHTVI